MAYDEFLADRVRMSLKDQNSSFSEKKMFGGLCFMVDEKMCMGITQHDLMARIDPEFYQEALAIDGVREMDFTGRAMKGYVYLDAEAVDMDSDLAFWVKKCLEFNPKAKASKKKK
jgi:TfoX/Sxy family transcriptional regulator of competence genes